nr:M56 family metallopeptidase [Oscillospiraceae bacterium]
MTSVFLQLCNASFTATWVVLAVLVLRLCLKKAPKWVNCVLWGVVGLRLMLPFSVESALSLIPSAQVLPQEITTGNAPIHSGIAAVDKAVNPTIVQPTHSPDLWQSILAVLAIVWLVGLGIMVLYGVVSAIGLHRSVRPSVRYRDNIYFCDNVDSPFILGVFFPKVYLPSGLSAEQMEAVIAHENAHLKRKDHWWKPLGYALLMVYWFNPALWAAYILLCRDIELACDEKVIKTMDNGAKKAYSQALVDCSCNRRSVLACPLAFGEVGVKDRIKAVLHYKKPTVWILGAAVVAVAVLMVCFLTDPKPCNHTYDKKITLAATCEKLGVETFTCRDCGHSYTQPVEKLAHTYGEAVVSLAATCTAEGEKQFFCTGCGDIRKEPIPMEAHNVTSTYVAKEPNCTATGEKRGQCLDCDQDCLVEILPTNDVHDLHMEVSKVATCAEAGEGKNTCSRCDHNEAVTLEKLGHSYT